jgi:hypothetical protein
VARFCGHPDHLIWHPWTFHFRDSWKITCTYLPCQRIFKSFVTRLLTLYSSIRCHFLDQTVGRSRISSWCLLHNQGQPYWTRVKKLGNVYRCSVTNHVAIFLFVLSEYTFKDTYSVMLHYVCVMWYIPFYSSYEHSEFSKNAWLFPVHITLFQSCY